MVLQIDACLKCEYNAEDCIQVVLMIPWCLWIHANQAPPVNDTFQNEHKLQKPVAHNLCSVYIMFYFTHFLSRNACESRQPRHPLRMKTQCKWSHGRGLFQIVWQAFQIRLCRYRCKQSWESFKKISNLTSRQSLPHITALAAQTALSNSRKTINK